MKQPSACDILHLCKSESFNADPAERYINNKMSNGCHVMSYNLTHNSIISFYKISHFTRKKLYLSSVILYNTGIVYTLPAV